MYVAVGVAITIIILILFFEEESYFVALSGLVFATRSGWP